MAERFHYTPDQIAEMNPFQQSYLLNIDIQETNTLSFRNIDEYYKWKAHKNFD